MVDRLHIVQEGEWLTSIARGYGFPRAEDIYDYEPNEPFRKLRPDPSVIFAGDELWVPPCPYETELELPSTGGEVSYKITGERPELETIDLIINGADGEALKNESYVLRISGHMRKGSTDGDGRLLEEFDPGILRYGRYELLIDETVIPLEVGHLDPIETTKGLQARLNNLGYDCGSVDGICGPATRAATRAFQQDNGLLSDGVAGPETRKKLSKLHDETG